MYVTNGMNNDFLLLQEFADAIMDVKNAIDDIKNSKTFKQVLGTLLAIGNFLNGNEVHSFACVCVCVVLYIRNWFVTPVM